jgi:hypothetical protein
MALNLRPSFDQFCRLSNDGNVVPVYAEIIADRDTPVSAFRKLNDGGPSFLFESTEQNERTGAIPSSAFIRASSCVAMATRFRSRRTDKLAAHPFRRTPWRIFRR